MKKDNRFEQSYLIDWSEIVGKTIKSVDDSSSCNVVKVTFTDGITLDVMTEPVMNGINTPVLLVPDA